MGCTSAKAKKVSSDFLSDENFHYKLIKRIINVADSIDLLKDEYLNPATINNKKYNIDFENYQIVNLNDFLLTAYKFNSCSKQKLKKLEYDICMILHEANDIYNKVNEIISKIDTNSVATTDNASPIKNEIEIIFRDFLVFFKKISISTHSKIPQVQFDDYTNYEISKRISNIDSQSILD